MIGLLVPDARLARAATTDTPGIQTDDSADILVPTSAWLVGPSTLASSSGNAPPCVMANQFNDGTLLRFSGAGQKLLAIAVSFRDGGFKAGETYAADLSMGGQFSTTINAEAYDASTLLIGMQGQPSAWRQLESARSMRLDVNGTVHEFALLGTDDGLRRLGSCSTATGDARSDTQDRPPARVPPVAADLPPDNVDPSYRAALAEVTGNAARPGAGRGPSFNDGPAVQAVPVPPVAAGMHTIAGKTPPAAAPVKAAPKEEEKSADPAQDDSKDPGSLIERLLKKTPLGPRSMVPASGPSVSYRQQQQVPPETQSQPLTPVPQIPAQAQAVAAPDLPRDNAPSVSTGGALAGSWMDTSAEARPARDVIHGLARTMPQAEISQAQPVSSGPYGAQRWRAMKGNSLRDILTSWARSENVRLLWGQSPDFSIKQSIALQGNFDMAVGALMAQYENDATHPVGHIYQDANGGQKVLQIDTQTQQP